MPINSLCLVFHPLNNSQRISVDTLHDLEASHGVRDRICLAQGDEKALEAKTEAFRKEMSYWERYLSESKFIAGDSFTLADLALVPQCLFFERQGATWDSYPKLKAYLAEHKVGQLAKALHAHVVVNHLRLPLSVESWLAYPFCVDRWLSSCHPIPALPLPLILVLHDPARA